MGGGGGYFSGRRSDIERRVEEVRAGAAQDDAEYDVATNDLLSGLLSEFNDRDVDGIKEHLDELVEAISSEGEKLVELRFGGSIAKHTYIDGLSDVDALVFLDGTDLAEAGPEAAKERLYSLLSERLPDVPVRMGDLAVTVEYPDAEVQLLPAIRDGERVRISAESGDRWSLVDPKGFAEKLTEVNQERGGKVVPTIKLAKALISQLPEPQRLSGYHTESLAVDVFKGYEGRLSPRDMLKYFFRTGAERVLSPIKDSTGQSIHVDDSLGEAGSVQRQVVRSAFTRIARRMDLADIRKRTEDWEHLFGEA